MAALLVPASLAHAAAGPARPTSSIVHATTSMRNDIAGGSIGSIPGVVAIATSSQYCTGAVIAPKMVLTAAHCLEGSNTASIRVRLDNSSQSVGVVGAYTAPGFNPTTHQNDAAVLILTSPTQAPALPVARTEPAAGVGARMTGFGQRTYTSGVANVAYYAATTVQSLASCQAAWAQYGSAVPSTDICAQNAPYNNATLTRGDSGGPLLVQSAAGQWSIAGINDLVVIPNDVYNGAIPQAFGRVDTIRPWLEAEIARFG
jgi:secreted trypsin-like serine protease